MTWFFLLSHFLIPEDFLRNPSIQEGKRKLNSYFKNEWRLSTKLTLNFDIVSYFKLKRNQDCLKKSLPAHTTVTTGSIS